MLVQRGLDLGRLLGIGMQQGTFRMVVQQIVAKIVVVEPVLLRNGQQRGRCGLVLLPRSGETFLPLLVRRPVPQLPGGLYALRPPREPITGNPVPHRIPRDAQHMADGLIALSLSVKGYSLLPQGVGVSDGVGHSS